MASRHDNTLSLADQPATEKLQMTWDAFKALFPTYGNVITLTDSNFALEHCTYTHIPTQGKFDSSRCYEYQHPSKLRMTRDGLLCQ